MKISISTIINVLIGFHKSSVVEVTEVADGYISIYISSGDGAGSLTYNQKMMWASNMSPNWSLLFAEINLQLTKKNGLMTPQEIQEAQDEEQARHYQDMFGHIGM